MLDTVWWSKHSALITGPATMQNYINDVEYAQAPEPGPLSAATPGAFNKRGRPRGKGRGKLGPRGCGINLPKDKNSRCDSVSRPPESLAADSSHKEETADLTTCSPVKSMSILQGEVRRSFP